MVVELNCRRKRLALGCGLALVLGSMLAASLSRGAEAKPADPLRDAEYRRLVLGTWHDEYQGKRTMTIRADGTATMVVQLSGLKAALYASQLEFDMTWSLENGRLAKRTISGRPTGKVKVILNLMGDRVNEPILELTQDRLLLLDENGKRKYDWRR